MAGKRAIELEDPYEVTTTEIRTHTIQNCLDDIKFRKVTMEKLIENLKQDENILHSIQFLPEPIRSVAFEAYIAMVKARD